MALVWTLEKLSALEPAKLEQVRRNALERSENEVAELCLVIQQSRKRAPATAVGPRNRDPVVGFHFVCKNDYEVLFEPDGAFLSGVWAIDDKLCDPAIKLGGYVALHDTKQQPSYRQGVIVGWTSKPRTKGTREMGVEFRLEPLPSPMQWYGLGSGERGYRRVTDEPRWPAK